MTHPQPAAGGSYMRDPVTGELTLIPDTQTLPNAPEAPVPDDAVPETTTMNSPPLEAPPRPGKPVKEA